MKKLLLGFALASLVIACKSDDNNQVSDASSAEIPAACGDSCGDGSSCCSDSAAAKSSCCSSDEAGKTVEVDG